MLYILVAIALVIGFTLYQRGRKRQLTQVILTDTQRKLLATHIGYYSNLSDIDKAYFEDKIEQFLDGVRVEGVGLTVTDLDRLMVASSAVIPIFRFKDWSYRNVTNVLLYPDTFDEQYQYEATDGRNIAGMVGTGYMNGQMILSRNALVKGFSSGAGKENTGIHEFVHLVDKSDGATDGIPEGFLPFEYVKPWVRMMHQEIHKIEAGHSDINPYATTNEAEFFAVVSEYFFEKPDQFQTKHPELYDMLSKIFGQDLAKG
ncbi:zinc-dependent peptidase [Mucilaginibacter sp. BJC16-A38]|uniref:M90 family metallopeptidase n=1 Tax=Mucilaginibacter phenanthrenivorans TaxID=1234842 RepID=UPI0021576C0B|nr:M90 family metallopeptidase [Mucilaginibacter phenanthrenivorans]MCR8557722.1 zinc-dependent peptidase [Mucilaginibacter phenanthrenivorans]